MTDDEALAIAEELLAREVHHFQSYLDDPMMEGQPAAYFEVARAEVARLTPALAWVRAHRA